MIDLNTLVSNALIAAVQQAVAPLNERIAALEDKLSTLTSHGVKTFETVDALTTRVVALETKLTEANLFTQTTNATITIDEARMVEALNSQEWFWHKIAGFVTNNSNTTQHIIDALSDIEHPLFKRLSSFMDAVAEQAMDHHLECYDHDNYDEMASKVDDLPDNLDDYATRDELRSEIEDVLNNATLSLSI